MNRFIQNFCILLLLFQIPAIGNPIEPLKPLRTDIPPVLDGNLDDPVWQSAPFETGFIIYYPDYGKNMTEGTRVWYAYDYENLYFAFKCYDSEPDKIKTSVSARDKIRSDDWICINLDTFNDQQTISTFYTNPTGIQMDSRATLTDEDFSIDMVWYSAARINEEGYNIELKIPFKSIRFSYTEPVAMGIIFERYISRKTEAGTYPALDPKWGQNFITQTRPLLYENVKHYRLVEVLPALTYSRNSLLEQGKLGTPVNKSDLSLTTKYGITSHLILDGTLNPDFSQVEADAGQIEFNQRYALFYPEKRPFFLEGKENFVFGGSTEGDPLGAVVHTRTIADPQVGIKLSGKLSPKNTIAAIYALDDLPESEMTGKYAHNMIFRYKHALDQDSYVGGFYTDRELENQANRVIGADGQIRINRSSHIGLHGFYSQSKTPELAESYGHALGINYYYRTRDWFINLRLHDLSENFDTEIGYLTRNNITRLRAGVVRYLYPDSKIIKRIDPLFNNQFIKDKESNQWENNNAFYLTFLLPGSSILRMGYAYAHEIFLNERFQTGGFSLTSVSQLTRQLYFEFLYSIGKKIRYQSEPYQGKGSSASGNIILQFSDNFQSSLSLDYSDLYRKSTGEKIFDYTIVRSKNTYQINKYLFFRIIAEYSPFHNYELSEKTRELTTDFLISFTYIPGTVIHLGYGSFYERIEWKDEQYVDSDRFLESKRSFFFKTSYLWRM
ncbi:carbohydrate binding family 9 domain-containing protein [candidate division KSB1 bacterium]|nr:carbohydrate binding family 9 domain-containing protein [candidate division KSB1 bacterium]